MPIHYTPRLRSVQLSRAGTIYHEPSPRWRRAWIQPNADPQTTIPFIDGRNQDASIIWEDGGKTPYLAFSRKSVPFENDPNGERAGYYLKESKELRAHTNYPRHGNLASTFYDVVNAKTGALVPGLEKAAWTWDVGPNSPFEDLSFAEAYPELEGKKDANTKSILGNLVGINEHQLGTWFEENERIIPDVNFMAHFRDPFHRVDAVRSTRHVQIFARDGEDGKPGVLLAESRDFILVFETALPDRYYLRKEDVIDAGKILSKEVTDLITVCPYKGLANYHHVYLPDGTVLENQVWTLRDPLVEYKKLQNLLAFYAPGPEFRLVVDGEEVKGL